MADWLTDDVNGSFEFWHEWLNDNSEDMQNTESNSTWLEKDGNMVTMGSLADIVMYWPKGLDVPEENKVVLTIKNTIKLIDSWKRLLKIKPEQIIIYEKSGIYHIEEAQ